MSVYIGLNYMGISMVLEQDLMWLSSPARHLVVLAFPSPGRLHASPPAFSSLQVDPCGEYMTSIADPYPLEHSLRIHCSPC